MHSVSSIFLEKIKQSDRVVRGKLLLGGVELTQEDIISMSIESSLGNGNIPAIGGVVASRLEVKLIKDNVPTVITTQELKPLLGIETSFSGTIEYVPMGVFRVSPQDITKTDKTITLVGYDVLYQLEDTPYTTTLTFPVEWGRIEVDLKTKGFKFKTQSLPNVIVKNKPNTIRELLSDVAELMGMNVVSNRLGEIEFRKLNAVDFELDASNYIDFKLLADDDVKITRLTVEKEGEEESDLTYGDDTGFTITIKNDSITTQSELTTVYNRVFPIQYIAYECNLQGMPHLDVGDIIKLTDRHDVVRYIPIVYHKITYSGGLRSEIRANAPSGAVSSAGSTGSNSITQSLRDLRVNLLEVNHVLADKASINDLEANTARIETLESSVADIDTLLAGNLTAENIRAGAITAESGIIAEGAIGTAQIADGSITDAKILELSANKITSGTIDAANIEVINLKAANITVGTINGHQIAPGAIDMEHLDEAITGQINKALTTADGKNTIYYQASAPTGGEYQIGDTWYDIENDYRMYRYDGSNWQPVQFGASAFEDGIIDETKFAESVNQLLDDIASTANSAKTSADGKNSVFYSNTAPSTNGRKTGDTWFHTGEGNKIYRWDGSKWVAEEFGKDAIANGIVDADKLASTINTKINDAFTKANTAMSDAAVAMATADGKNTVFYQSSQPSTSGRKTGDVWFNTADGHKMYRWDGSAWVAAQFGTNAIANGSITNALIKDATIQSAKIANLDAGKITTGYISPARIEAGSITAEKLEAGTITAESGVIANGAIRTAHIGDAEITNAKIANGAISNVKIADGAITNAKIQDATIESAKIKSIDAAKITSGTISADRIGSKSIVLGKLADDAINGIIDKVEVGGRNYLLNSDFSQGQNGWRGFSSDGFKLIEDSEGNYVQVSKTGETSIGVKASLYNDGKMPCEKGDKIVISGLVKVTSWDELDTQYFFIYEEYNTTGIRVSYQDVQFTSPNVELLGTREDNVWIPFIFTKTVQHSDAVEVGLRYSIFKNGEISYKKWKLEKGNKATDWTPAPEDIDQSIAENSIANWCYNNDLTYIDGGKIYTGTITAEQIAANAITGDKILGREITASHIKTGTITSNELAANSVIAGKIAANAVATGNIQANAITTDKIATNAITAEKISANTITGDKMVAETITAREIASNAITANKIASNAITADKIAANAVTSDKINVNSLSAISANLGTITGGSLNIGNGAFKVSSAGKLEATGADISGKITATSGSIGSWNISSNYIMPADEVAGIGVGTTPTVFWAGYDKTNNSYQFRVTRDGVLTARKGTIGNWSVDQNIYAYNNTLYTTLKSSGNVAFAAGAPSHYDTTGANLQIYHDGRIRMNHNGNTRLLIQTDRMNFYDPNGYQLAHMTAIAESQSYWDNLGTLRLRGEQSSLELMSRWSSTNYAGIDLYARENPSDGVEAGISLYALRGSGASAIELTSGGLTIDSNRILLISSTAYLGFLGTTYVEGSLRPWETGTYSLGSSSYRWTTAYLTSNPNVSSDVRLKENIQSIPDDLIEELKEIQPKMFQQYGKWHFGYIAQDVERALYKYALKKVGWENAREYVKEFEVLYKDESYLSLIYAEVAVLKEAEMQRRIDELEKKLKTLEEQISN